MSEAAAAFGPRGEQARRRLLGGPVVRLWMWRTLPLAAFAGLSVARLDGEACAVRLPGGWRTQNPFRSTYFAAQAMAAEMSTGAPALVLLRDAAASIAMLVVGLRVTYGRSWSAPASSRSRTSPGCAPPSRGPPRRDEPQLFAARSVGRGPDGGVVAEFEITWSFKRRSRA